MAVSDELTAADEVQRLTVERDQIQGQLDAALLQIGVLKHDLETIGLALRREAEDRGWCSDYRAFVDTVNAKCSDAHLQPCATRWRLSYRVDVEVSTDDLDGMERQLHGELEIVEMEGGPVHRTDVSLVSRSRVE